jgi:hypothetical protein
MSTFSDIKHDAPLRSTPVTVGICVFVAIAGFFLWEEHRAHVLGILPYLLLAACPIVHLFMHGRHGGHHGHSPAGHARRYDDGARSSAVEVSAGVRIGF